MNIFDPALNDQSIYYLGRIFGIVGTVIPKSNFPAGEAAPVILSEMFGVLNGVALTIGVLVVTYTTVVGLFATAAEGEFLGKKWSGLWVPIRTVIGIAGLFPSSNGYCAIQVVLMWFILQGVGAADLVWAKALEVINMYGNPKSGVETPGAEDVENKMQSLFTGLVCQATAARKDPPVTMLAGGVGGGSSEPQKTIEYYCTGKTGIRFCEPGNDIYNMTDGGTQFFRPASQKDSTYLQYNFGPINSASEGGACGYVQYSNNNYICSNPNAGDRSKLEYLACLSANAQVKVLDDIIRRTLGPIAQKYTDLDYQFIRFYEEPEPTTSGTAPKTPDWILQFCLAPEGASPPGLGLSAAECCAYDKSCGAFVKFFANNGDLYDRQGGYAGMTSSSKEASRQIYQAYGMPTITNTNFIQTAADQYVQKVYTEPLKQYMQDKPKDKWIQDATNLGWLMAGGYYMQIAKTKKSENAAADPLLQIKINDTAKKPMEPYHRNNLVTAAQLTQNITDQNRPSSAATELSLSSTTDSTFKNGHRRFTSIVERFINNLTQGSRNNPGDDPIVSIAQSGYEMMASAQALFVSLAVTASVIATVSSVSPMVLGTGLPKSPWEAGFVMMMRFLGPLMILMISTLFTVGAMLGVYVPLVPYIIFTITAIGWFIAVIEAMTAAPFIALGIMSPGGQHEILSRAEPSLMILFNLFLRPVLMIFGMIAAMLLSWAVVKMINAAFVNVMYQIIFAPGLIEQIVFMSAYTMLVITALNKCYSVIHMLPERTLTYIGGHAIQFGEEQAMQAIKGGVEGASGAMAKGGRAGAVAAAKSDQYEGKTSILGGENKAGPSGDDKKTK